MDNRRELVFRLIPLLVLIGLWIIFGLFNDGLYILYGYFLHTPVRGVAVYAILSLLVCFIPVLYLYKKTILLSYFAIICCFYFINEIFYRFFSRLLMVQKEYITIWENHVIFQLIAFLFIQYLLKLSGLSVKERSFGTILMIIAAFAAVYRDMRIPNVMYMWWV